MAVYTDNGTNTPNGSHLEFTYTFPTIKTDGSDVKVALNNQTQATNKYTVTTTSPTKITFNNTNVDTDLQESTGAPKTGVTVRVYRDTYVDAAEAVYAAGSSIRALDLNNNQDQVLYALQEEQQLNLVSEDIGTGVINSTHIKDGTIATVDIADDAITEDKIADNSVGQNQLKVNSIVSSTIVDGSIVDADINASAAIAQSKIALDAELTELATMSSGTASALADLTQTEVQILDGVTATTAELNYVDGVTSNIQTQLDAKQASDAELTELATMHTDTASALADLTQAEVQILDGATVTTTELNKLDGVTASATDLNITASMTKQTTISDSDTSYPTSGAVVDYVAAQIAPIGGLEVIATDAAFPNTQPAAGVVISIADAGGLVVNGSGVSTTGRTVGASTVTINGINSSFHSTTIDAGIGMLVTSTGSGQIYDYHKTVIKESDVAQISDDINDFNSRYRIASSAPGSANDEGDLYFDTSTNKMYVYDGSAWGQVTSTGDFKYLTLCAFNTGTGNAAVFNGSISKYDLRENSTSGSLASVTNAAQLTVSVNGVVQKPNTGTSIGSNDGFCMVDDHTIEFGANIPSSSEVFVVQSGSALSLNVPADGVVTEAMLNANAPTNDHVLTADSSAAGGFKWAAGGDTDKISEGNSSAEITGGGSQSTDFGTFVVKNEDGTHSNAAKEILKIYKSSGTKHEAEFFSEEPTTGQVEINCGNGGSQTAGVRFTGAQGTDLTKFDIKWYPPTTTLVFASPGDSGNRLDLNGNGALFGGYIWPSADNSKDIGSASLRWQDVYAVNFHGDGSNLTGVASATADGCMYENDQTISNNYTIAAGKGAHSVGPITVNATVTVNGNWVVS